MTSIWDKVCPLWLHLCHRADTPKISDESLIPSPHFTVISIDELILIILAEEHSFIYFPRASSNKGVTDCSQSPGVGPVRVSLRPEPAKASS